MTMIDVNQTTTYPIIGLVLVILLAGCAGLGPSASDNTDGLSTVDPNADTSGDGIPDQRALDLNLDPDTEYDPLFVETLDTIQSEDPEAAQTFAEHFATRNGVPNGSYSTLENYSAFVEQNPEAIENGSQQLLDGNSNEFVDKQISVLNQVDDDERKTIIESKDLGDDDWANSGLKNWEEIEHGTDILAADTSGDGIPDGASVHNDSAYPDANPLQKDVYVEINTVPGADIENQDLRRVERKFDNAPVENPDGTEGINLHLIENKEIDNRDWELTDLGDHSEFNRKGYHYIVIANRGAVQDASGIAYVSTAAVEDHGSPQTGSTLMHEIGHLLGLDEDLHGVDSKQLSFNEYKSTMNYNGPSSYYGFSDGSDSTEGAYDWKHIECAMASKAQRGMFISSVPFEKEVLRAAEDEAPLLGQCVFGMKLSELNDEIYLRDPNASITRYADEAEVKEEIKEWEEDSEYTVEYEIFEESETNESIPYTVTINNTGDYAETQTVRFDPWLGAEDLTSRQTEEVSLAPGEETTITFDIETSALKEAGWLRFKLKTDDHSRNIVAGVIQ